MNPNATTWRPPSISSLQSSLASLSLNTHTVPVAKIEPVKHMKQPSSLMATLQSQSELPQPPARVSPTHAPENAPPQAQATPQEITPVSVSPPPAPLSPLPSLPLLPLPPPYSMCSKTEVTYRLSTLEISSFEATAPTRPSPAPQRIPDPILCCKKYRRSAAGGGVDLDKFPTRDVKSLEVSVGYLVSLESERSMVVKHEFVAGE